ncbi:hypothetical protein [Chitinophaga silvatica]|uniref:hypothetical protein n=1 Tax=Chitinophaga silvatica TaxID=2282649 RepID=UPI001314C9AC|nr:hypothetical protein [Chitinophaga silvatica]
MAKRHQQNRPRLRIAAGLCIAIGLLLGISIKRVHVGLIIGIALGLLTSGMWTRGSSND